jgi:hypothetical protein
MINNHNIDVGVALRRSVAHLYSDLVTRPTGAAVRNEIEQQLALVNGRAFTVIDFSQVGLLDFSCADEVIAKLLLRYCADCPPHDGYFLFRGVREDHYDAIEAVLERHALALAVQTEDGVVRLVGAVDDLARAAWELLERDGGRRTPAQLAEALCVAEEEAARAVALLCRRRLAIAVDDAVMAVGRGLLPQGRAQ